MTWKTSKRWARIRPTRRTPHDRWSRQIFIEGTSTGAYATVDPDEVGCYRASMHSWFGGDRVGLGCFATLDEAQEAAWAAALAWARDRGYKETP